MTKQIYNGLKSVKDRSNIILAYDNLTLVYDILDFDSNPYLYVNQLVSNFIAEASNHIALNNASRLIEVPVCYDPSLGIDLEAAAKIAKMEADRTKAAQEVATVKVAETKKVADEAKAAQQKEVDKLRAVQRKLAAELAKAKTFRVTLEQQRQLALLEESNANTATKTPNQFKVWPNKGFTGRTTIRSTEEIRTKAVAYAKKQVLARNPIKPYVWGAQGPNSFDCSGLVYAAYKSAGLGWPNWDRLNSALYSGYTKHVSLNELVPGDLLFYSYKGTISTIHHITIYAGGGMMWEANSKGKGLLYSNIYSVKGLMPFGGRV